MQQIQYRHTGNRISICNRYIGGDTTPGGVGDALLLAGGVFGLLLTDGLSYLLLASE